MKILILKNKFNTSLKKKLTEVNKFFNNEDEYVEETTNFVFPNSDYTYADENNKIQTYKAVDETWYDENISKPAKAKGFDIVIFIIKGSSWLAQIVEGFGTSIPDFGIEEIAVRYFTSGTYQFNDVKLKGDKMVWILIHEILHRKYHIKGLTDNTHKYFLEGKPEKCLEDFKPMPKYKYFSEKEVSKFKLTDETWKMLDKAREISQTPYIISSGYRTVEENTKIGGKSNSAHLRGLACDLVCTSKTRQAILRGLLNCGIPVFIEDATNHVHVDMDSTIHTLGDAIVGISA